MNSTFVKPTGARTRHSDNTNQPEEVLSSPSIIPAVKASIQVMAIYNQRSRFDVHKSLKTTSDANELRPMIVNFFKEGATSILIYYKKEMFVLEMIDDDPSAYTKTKVTYHPFAENFLS